MIPALSAAAGAASGGICFLLSQKLAILMAAKRDLPEKTEKKLSYVFAVFMVLTCSFLFWKQPAVPTLIYCLALLVCAGVAAVMDIRHRIIPNEIIVAMLIIRLGFGIPAIIGVGGFPKFHLIQALTGLAACFLIFTLPALWGKSVGAGDIKFAAAIGFCLGLNGALLAIAGMGLLVLGYLFLQKHFPVLQALKSQIPMGPFLSLGMLAVLLFSGSLMQF